MDCPDIAAPRTGVSPVARVLLISGGTACVGLGALGVFLPVLPTTPFLLLAAACFLRSSRKLYRWLLGNRIFGQYLCRYLSGEGLPQTFKIVTIILLWISLGLAGFCPVPERLWILRLLLLGVGIGVTIHLCLIPTSGRKDSKLTESGRNV